MTDSAATPRGISRKKLLTVAVAAIPVPLLLTSGMPASAETTLSGQPLAVTPTCDDGDDPTPRQTEGPYFKRNSPLRSSMVDGPGTQLTVSGYVFGLHCRPIANALLEFWQADTNGAYDNAGFKFRSHQFTNAQGAFNVTTVVPGLYPGRTRHIHIKVQAPNQPVLTSQLYFPNEPRNNTDRLFNPALLMTVQTVGSAKVGTFDFILNVA